MAKEGATTIWELWNGNTADPAMNSGNHVMLLGDLVVWFYEDLAGIRSSDSLTGFRQIEMKPYPVKGLDHVAASYHSVHGMISSSWSATDGQFSWDVTVPANTTAEVYIPAASSADVTEGGKKADGAESVKFLRQEGSRAVFQIGSGTYHFVSKSFKSL
jgi:alpha-L-rhamnosidase